MRHVRFLLIASCSVVFAQQAAADEPLTLERAMTLAVGRDPRAGQAVERVGIAHRATYRAISPLVPRINATATFIGQTEINATLAVQGLPMPVTFSVQKPYQFYYGANAQLAFNVEMWRLRSQARATERQSQGTVGRVKAQVTLDVATAFFDVLRSERRRSMAEAASKRAIGQRDLVSARRSLGVEMRTASLQAELEMQRAERLLAESAAQSFVAREVLSRLTGMPPDVTLVQPEATRVPATAVDVDAAYTQRAEVKESMEAAEAARLALSAARWRFAPTLLVNGQYTRTQYPTTLLPEDTWSVGATLVLPILQGGVEYIELADRRAQQRIASLEVDAVKNAVREQVLRARSTLQISEKTIVVVQRQVTLAKENYDLLREQFKAGVARPTDLTFAQVALSDAEDQLVVATYDRELAALQMKFALGTLGPQK